MRRITAATSMEEVATLVSEALFAAGIPAVLSGGGAVTLYSDSRYMSTDLDFITTERNRNIAPVVAQLGFKPKGKDFVHDQSQYFLEFPPGPIAFGDRYIDESETALIQTRFGKLRIITPTQCLMDRISWFVHGRDPQARVQAILVAERQEIDWQHLYQWADSEGIPKDLVEGIRSAAQSAGGKAS